MTDLITERDALVARLEDENARLRRELAAKDQEITAVESQNATAIHNLRRALSPLYTALRQVFGEIEAVAGPESPDTSSPSSHSSPRVASVWAEWKAKLPPSCGKVIDALLVHGELSGPQIIVAAKMSAGTLHGGSGVLAKLRQVGLLQLQNGRYSLKSL